MYSSSVGQQALLLYVSCSALLVAPVPALLRGPKPALLLGFSLVVHGGGGAHGQEVNVRTYGEREEGVGGDRSNLTRGAQTHCL